MMEKNIIVTETSSIVFIFLYFSPFILAQVWHKVHEWMAKAEKICKIKNYKKTTIRRAIFFCILKFSFFMKYSLVDYVLNEWKSVWNERDTVWMQITKKWIKTRIEMMNK